MSVSRRVSVNEGGEELAVQREYHAKEMMPINLRLAAQCREAKFAKWWDHRIQTMVEEGERMSIEVVSTRMVGKEISTLVQNDYRSVE